MIRGVLFDMDGVFTDSFRASVLKEADRICGSFADVPEEALNW